MDRTSEDFERRIERCLQEWKYAHERAHQRWEEIYRSCPPYPACTADQAQSRANEGSRYLKNIADELSAKLDKVREEYEEYKNPDIKYQRLKKQMQSASPHELRNLAQQFRKFNYKDSLELADKCESKAKNIEQEEKRKAEEIQKQKIEQERIRAEQERIRIEQERKNKYNNAVTQMQKLKEKNARGLVELRNLTNEWNQLYRTFVAFGVYKDASDLGTQCKNRFEEWKQKTEKEEVRVAKAAAVRRFFGRSIAWILLIGSIVALFIGIVGIITFAGIPENDANAVFAVFAFVIGLIVMHLLIFNSFIFFRVKQKKGLRVFGLILMILWSFFIFMTVGGQYRFLSCYYYSDVSMAVFLLASSFGNLMASIFAFAFALEKKASKLLRSMNFLFVVCIVSALAYGSFSGLFDYYKETNNYSEGLASAEFGNLKSRKWGFIDESRKVTIPFAYSDVTSFSDGLAAVKKDKWGFIDKTGNEIISLKYDAVESFSNGMAKVKTGNQWGFINKSGVEVIPCKYDAIAAFSDGLAAVSSNGKWGFIDNSGRIIIPIQYDNAESFRSDGYAKVGTRSDTGVRGWAFLNGLIDRRGNLVIPFKYNYIGAFNGELAVVTISKNQAVTRGNTRSTQVVTLQGVINKSGQEVISPADYHNISIRDGIIEVKASRNANSQYFDQSGNRVRR